jgi:acetate kinase
VDAVAFTAGVGVNADFVRAAAFAYLEGVGLAVEGARNAVRGDEARLISPEGARVAVAVVPTDEEMEIASQTYALVGKGN